MVNAKIVPCQPRVYLYHAYLVYMQAHGYKNTLNLTMFSKWLSDMLKEYGLHYDKRRGNHAMQPNLTLREESNTNWLPQCDNRRLIESPKPAIAGLFFLQNGKSEQ